MSLNGKKVVLTGALSQLTRAEAKTKLEAAGAQIMSGVSKNVDIVICGDAAGSKLAKAESLGLEIWDEDKLVAAVSGKKAAASKTPAKKSAATEKKSAKKESTPKTKSPSNNALKGKKVVLTGTLTQLKRAEAKTQLEAAGAQIMSGVSKNVDLVICGTDAGSKLEKAESLGLEIWDEDQLVEALSGGKKAATPAKKRAAPEKKSTEKEPTPKKAKTATKSKGGQVLAGAKFVLTGKLSRTKEEVTELIESHGGKVVKKVSKNVNALIVGENAGSAQRHADEMGIKHWCEAELDEALEGNLDF